MKYLINPSGGEEFSLPQKVLDCLASASREELAVLLYLAGNGGVLDPDAAQEALRLPESAILAAAAFWRGAGVAAYAIDGESMAGSVSAKKADTVKDALRASEAAVPAQAGLSEVGEENAAAGTDVAVISDTRPSERKVSYSAGELADAIEANEDVRSLMAFAGERLGKVLTPGEQSDLYALLDAEALPFEYVMALIDYCVNHDKRSVRYISRKAEVLVKEYGVDSYEKLEAYLEGLEKAASLEGTVRRVLGIGERAFTKKENGILRGWGEAAFAGELIERAYELTINAIAKPSMPYMDTILRRWAADGIRTLEELEASEAPFDGTTDGKSSGSSSSRKAPSGKGTKVGGSKSANGKAVNGKAVITGTGAFSLDDFSEKPEC